MLAGPNRNTSLTPCHFSFRVSRPSAPGRCWGRLLTQRGLVGGLMLLRVANSLLPTKAERMRAI
jgi:hypothetical protein